MFEMEYGDVAVRAEERAGLVIASVRGRVTPVAAQMVMAGSHAWAPSRVAQVVNYAEADVCLDVDRLFAAAMRAKPGATPTALVVRIEHLAMFRDYANKHVELGVLKVAVTDIEAAQRWAAQQALVGEYWARLMRSRQSVP